MHHPTDRIVYTTDFVTPAVEIWLEREIAEWVYHEKTVEQNPCLYYTAYILLFALLIAQVLVHLGLHLVHCFTSTIYHQVAA